MDSPTKLFKVEEIRKFFAILDRLSGSTPVDKSNYPWKDYQTIYTKESNHCPSTREVFVHRTINKWLKGKALIIYRESDLGVTYKQYVSISNMTYCNSMNSLDYISVGIVDYAQPCNGSLFGGLKINHNDALYLEGEWCDNLDKHVQIMNLVLMKDIPEKEYIFKAWDFAKFKRKSKHNPDPKKSIETTKSFTARTEKQAYKAKRMFEEQSKEHKGQLYIGELIEVKLIN